MREIIFSDEFEDAVVAMGGYRAIDPVLDTIIDGLMLNPYGFPRHESDHASFRYAITEPVSMFPSLIVIFDIDHEKNVILLHVENYEPYL